MGDGKNRDGKNGIGLESGLPGRGARWAAEWIKRSSLERADRPDPPKENTGKHCRSSLRNRVR